MPTKRIIVFGGGTILDENGRVRLRQSSIERAERAIDYYNVHKELFINKTRTRQPFILCTGGYGLLSAEVKEREPNDREAALMADYLVTKGGLPREIILLEQESISTLTNWTRSIYLYGDKLDARLFNQTDRLGLVSHPHHLKRIVYLAEKLGYSKDILEPIPTTQTDNQNYESHILATYREYLKDTNNSLEMEEREKDLASNTTLMYYLRSLQ